VGRPTCERVLTGSRPWSLGTWAAARSRATFFLFVNRSRTLAKVLVWDGTGLCIYGKRLEQGRFACL
jgi:hypothetical protein